MAYSSSFSKAHRKEVYRRLGGIVRGNPPSPVPSFTDLRSRLHLFHQTYVGLRTIRVDQIVGTVNRSQDFDKDFLPRSSQTRERWERLERAFPSLGFPPISVYQVNQIYFVIDGNHRVALAKQKGAEFIDAEITEIHTNSEIDEDISFDKIVHLEQAHRFMDESGLASSRPNARFEFTRPEGFADLLSAVKVHGYEMMMKRKAIVSPGEIAADWYDTVYRPTIEAIRTAGLPELEAGLTEDDFFLWVQQRRREHDGHQGEQTPQDAAKEALASLQKAKRGFPRRPRVQ